MSSQIMQGLILSVVGISLTFLALGILILLMILLERLFRDKTTAAATETIPAQSPPVRSAEPKTADEEIVAVIAAALAYVRSPAMGEDGLGATLASGPSRWWFAGRTQQNSAQALKINRWRT